MINFENLPNAVYELTKEVNELKALLISNNELKQITDKEKFIDIKQASVFLNLSVSTIYSKVSRLELPVNKRGKKLYFSDHDLIAYIKQGKKKTNEEIDLEANKYLNKKW